MKCFGIHYLSNDKSHCTRGIILNCPDLVKRVVDACSLQVGSDVIQKSVVLFWVGQGWILVVSFNVCQQRPGCGGLIQQTFESENM